MKAYLESTPLFGVVLCLVAFLAAAWLKERCRPLNTFLLSVVFIVAFLLLVRVRYESFKIGGDYVHFFLGPITVMLAVPLYRQRHLLRRHRLPIFAGVLAGCAVAIGSVVLLSRCFGLDAQLERSLVSKSVSIPFGIEITRNLDGIESIAVLAISLTGILGASTGPFLCRLFRIRDEIAQGVGIGTCSHVLGTSRAFEMGERQGAMSSVALGISGLATAASVLCLKAWLFP
ncbi:MAG: LrgB family protein [Puniceicoccales bacterium]|jgi:putative effector of murein hydrolase|nr:LrgB family protein [Puniceicoccales bacterium]